MIVLGAALEGDIFSNIHRMRMRRLSKIMRVRPIERGRSWDELSQSLAADGHLDISGAATYPMRPESVGITYPGYIRISDNKPIPEHPRKTVARSRSQHPRDQTFLCLRRHTEITYLPILLYTMLSMRRSRGVYGFFINSWSYYRGPIIFRELNQWDLLAADWPTNH